MSRQTRLRKRIRRISSPTGELIPQAKTFHSDTTERCFHDPMDYAAAGFCCPDIYAGTDQCSQSRPW